MARKGHKQEEIYRVALQVIEEKQNGIRYSDLHREIMNRLREASPNTIHGTLLRLRRNILEGKEKNVSMPERGLFVWSSQRTSEQASQHATRNFREEDFYKPFASYLVEELGECTKAVVLGGNIFQDKWGTPDVKSHPLSL